MKAENLITTALGGRREKTVYNEAHTPQLPTNVGRNGAWNTSIKMVQNGTVLSLQRWMPGYTTVALPKKSKLIQTLQGFLSPARGLPDLLTCLSGHPG